MSILGEITKDPEDLYKEHKFHNTYEPHCSTCYSENRILQAKKLVGRHDNYPPGFNIKLLD